MCDTIFQEMFDKSFTALEMKHGALRDELSPSLNPPRESWCSGTTRVVTLGRKLNNFPGDLR